MLDNQLYRKNLDKNHILLLLKLYEFTPGVTKMCEILNLKTELLNYYLTVHNIDDAVEYCKKNGRYDSNLWITT